MKNIMYLFISFFLSAQIFAQAPDLLSATAYRTTVHLQWQDDPNFEAVGYHIYRSTQSGVYNAPSRTIGAYNEYTDYNLQSGTTYFYTITAFDSNGNESSFSNEISTRTDEQQYLKVASLDLLVPIYTGGMNSESPDQIKQSLEFARLFYYRNTFARLNLNYHYIIIDGYPPANANGVADFNTIGADLRSRGITDNLYDCIYIMANQLYGWRGGATWLGQTAGSMGFDWRSFNPDNHFTEGNAWLFTHEFGHALDFVIAGRSGYPEMLINHFADAYASLPCRKRF